jgi:FkbM family methyltransferase
LTRALLHPRWRNYPPVSSAYLRLYLFGKRLTERHELSALRRLIAPGMVIADVGANAGFYTWEMASMVGPAGRIVAFEPDAFNYQLLQARLKRTRATNVEVHQIALGDSARRAILYCSAYNRADNRLHQSHREPHVEASDVQVLSLDEFMARRGGALTVDALKIDVQGAEDHVLRGARTLLAGGVRWIWIEFSPDHLRGAGTDPAAFVQRLESLTMDMFEVAEAGSLVPFSGFESYSRRIGSGYGDLLLTARAQEGCSRANP